MMFRLFGLLLVGLVLAAGQAMAQSSIHGTCTGHGGNNWVQCNPQITGKI